MNIESIIQYVKVMSTCPQKRIIMQKQSGKITALYRLLSIDDELHGNSIVNQNKILSKGTKEKGI